MPEDSAQKGIINQSSTPGAIPRRSPSISELVELKLMCRDSKHGLEGIYANFKTLNLAEDFDHADEIMDEMGRLLDSIAEFCSRSLKRMDEKKGRRS
jgi:hypothetical protein